MPAQTLTRDRKDFIADLERGRLGGWGPFLLAFQGAPVAAIEQATAELQVHVQAGGFFNQQDPASILSRARRLGYAAPDKILALINAASNAGDRPAQVSEILLAFIT